MYATSPAWSTGTDLHALLMLSLLFSTKAAQDSAPDATAPPGNRAGGLGTPSAPSDRLHGELHGPESLPFSRVRMPGAASPGWCAVALRVRIRRRSLTAAYPPGVDAPTSDRNFMVLAFNVGVLLGVFLWNANPFRIDTRGLVWWQACGQHDRARRVRPRLAGDDNRGARATPAPGEGGKKT